jgi:hypothetical protein
VLKIASAFSAKKNFAEDFLGGLPQKFERFFFFFFAILVQNNYQKIFFIEKKIIY